MTSALLLLALAVPSWAAFFGSGKEPAAVLWLPEDRFADWEAPRAAFERCSSLSLTLAAAPGQAAAAKRELADAFASGRLELALRLPGDPLLPAVLEHSAGLEASRFAERAHDEAERFKTAVGTAPAGFVPGAGALAPAALGAFAALPFKWLAAGPYAPSTGPWASAGASLLVPFSSASGADGNLGELAEGRLVVDEALGLARPGEFARVLREIGTGGRKCPSWRIVSDSIPDGHKHGPPPRAGFRRAAWTDLAPWTGGPASRAAWSHYEAAAAAVTAYRNSGSADERVLDAAFEALAKAEASALYRGDGPEAPARERELRAALLPVYRKLKEPPPDALLGAPGTEPAGKAPAAGLRVSRGDSWLAFENPSGSLARAPEAGAALGEVPSALFKLRRLKVEWSEPGTTLTWTMERLTDGGGPLLLETYLDLNGQPRVGSTQLLEPKTGGVAARDAWEYALSVSEAGALLLRASALGSPTVVGRLTPVFEPSAGEVRVFVPSSLLRGHPERWGWLVAAFALDPHAKDRQPPRASLEAPGALRGLLGSVERQKEAFAAAKPRLEALRVQ